MSVEPPQLHVVLTTVATAEDAKRLAHTLVDRRLVACAQIVPGLTSVYRWRGEVCEDGEQLMVLKTAPGTLEALREELLTEHPYDTPEFVVVDASASSGYLAWALAQLATGG